MKKNSPSLRHDEFHRAGADIVDRLRRGDRGFAHRACGARVEEGRGRFLQHLLVAALRRALALVEMDDVAVGVAEHLEFDMPRMLDVALEDHARVAERAGRLALRRGQRVGEFGFSLRTMRMPLPPPPAAALIISGKPVALPARRDTRSSWSSP
jgi:hypothetical protein